VSPVSRSCPKNQAVEGYEGEFGTHRADGTVRGQKPGFSTLARSVPDGCDALREPRVILHVVVGLDLGHRA
jgi:hypothetical protein